MLSHAAKFVYLISNLPVIFCFILVFWLNQASHGYERTSSTLLEHGADVTVTDDYGRLDDYHFPCES